MPIWKSQNLTNNIPTKGLQVEPAADGREVRRRAKEPRRPDGPHGGQARLLRGQGVQVRRGGMRKEVHPIQPARAAQKVRTWLDEIKFLGGFLVALQCS